MVPGLGRKPAIYRTRFVPDFTIYDTLEPSFLVVMLRIITLLFTVEQWVHRNRHKTLVDND